MNLWTQCCNCWKQFGRPLHKANKPTLRGFISLHPPLNKGEERWLYGSVNVCTIFKDWKPGGISIAGTFSPPFLYLSFNKNLLILSQSYPLLSWARLPSPSITVPPVQCSQAYLTPPYRSNPGLRHTSGLWGASPISLNNVSCGELSHGSPRTCSSSAGAWYCSNLAVGVSQVLRSPSPTNLQWGLYCWEQDLESLWLSWMLPLFYSGDLLWL